MGEDGLEEAIPVSSLLSSRSNTILTRAVELVDVEIDDLTKSE